MILSKERDFNHEFLLNIVKVAVPLSITGQTHEKLTSICFFTITNCPIGHVRYINILTWLQGFRVKIANFSSFFGPSVPKRDLDQEIIKVRVWTPHIGLPPIFRHGTQGRVVRKPVNANPGLKVNRIINFSSLEMFLTEDILCSLRLL